LVITSEHQVITTEPFYKRYLTSKLKTIALVLPPV